MSLPFTTTDLPAKDFPFTIEFVNAAGETVWKQRVEGPGVLEIPGQGTLHEKVNVRITWPQGDVTWIPA